MSGLLPYIIVAAVVVAFLGVCYALLADKKPSEPKPVRRRHSSSAYNWESDDEKSAEPPAPVSHVTLREERKEPATVRPVAEVLTRSKGLSDYEQPKSDSWNHKSHRSPESEETRVLSESEILAALREASKTAKATGTTEQTIVMKPVQTRGEHGRTTIDRDATIVLSDEDSRVLKRRVATGSAANQHTMAVPQVAGISEPKIFTPDIPATTIRERCVRHFLKSYGIINDRVIAQVTEVTTEAFGLLGDRTEDELRELMAPITVQEAMQYMQKAYIAQPKAIVRILAGQAFADVALQPPASTQYLVAFDALKVMIHLTESHYKIMSILLLLLYSRNSNNINSQAFKQYTKKYIEPFMEDLLTNRSYFQQLEYLRCIVFESRENKFADVIADSYPLLFRYQGYTDNELQQVLRDEKLRAQFVVHSFNSSMFKFALVDDTMADQYFRKAGIHDTTLQEALLLLAKKRPIEFGGEESLGILERLAPALADLSEIWDASLFRSSTLSLLGLYLSRGFIRETIGEEFDLSRWF
jgi:hypothetical protein